MKRITIVIAVCVILAGAVAWAPYYLTRGDKPTKSDVIVLLIGSKLAPRKDEVFKLIEDGYARYLIIPAYGKVSDAGLFPNRAPQMNPKPDRSLARGRPVSLRHYPRHFEDTHVEIIEAKKMMDRAGFKSAIFVSSPYHMRRVSIIANTVFGKGGYRLTFVPSRYEQGKGVTWFLEKWHLNFVTREYSKIAWFLLYRHFPSS